MAPPASSATRLGRYEVTSAGGEAVRAFVPPALPPNPPLAMEGLYTALEAANRALGRLDGATSILPDTPLFLYMYVRKEALLSSQIEGTQSSLSDLLLFESDEAPGVPLDDVQEVSNYVAAMTAGLERLRGGFPLSARLIREIHEVLLAGARGGTKQPGEFRRTQNWVGGTRPGNAAYVPPPPHLVPDLVIAEARRRWPEFVAIFKNRQPDDERFIVKAPFTGEDGKVEHMWLQVFGLEPEYVHGHLVNHPMHTTKHKQGSQVEVPVAEVSDWVCPDAEGNPLGNFTHQAIAQAAKAKREA